MNKQLQQLREIEAKANAIANSVDVNCEESSKQYSELCELANELGAVINTIEPTN